MSNIGFLGKGRGKGTGKGETNKLTAMLKLISPAKINLFLKIIGRRQDGFHELASLFQAIDLHDILHFQFAEKDQLQCSDPKIPLGESNLIWKAVNLFRRKSGYDFGLHVELQKQIPAEAGLGGGSGNAATTLWALNVLHGNPFSEDTLREWAGEIGSDIAFFFSSGTAYCTGRGEIVQSLIALPSQQLSVAKPNFGISTPKVYANLNLSLLTKREPIDELQKFMVGMPNYFNDLEETALRIEPQLVQFKADLKQCGFSTVMLSGSGSAFVCFGDGEMERTDIFHCQARHINRAPGEWYFINSYL